MYESFIKYENSIHFNCTELETDSLESIQWRAARITSGGTISTPIRCLHEELATESVQTRRDRNVIKF